MERFNSSIITMCANLIVFGCIPFVWWVMFYRKKESFLHWLGFFKPQLKAKWWLIIVFFVLYLFFYNFDWTVFLDADTIAYLSENAASDYTNATGRGFVVIIEALFVNFIGNGVAEEILFRGFFCRRISEKWGSWTGIVVSSILFGLMHNLFIVLSGLHVGVSYHIFTFLFGTAAGFLLACANEKISNKSIWFSVLLHGIGNALGTLAQF